MPMPDFDTVADALGLAGAPGEPAQLHGRLCGLACVMGAEAGPPWVREALAGAAPDETSQDLAQRTLDGLAGETLQAMDAGNLGWMLLLPEDDESLTERAEGLSLWCRGFLHGLGTAEASHALADRPVTGEIVRDFSEIARAGYSEQDGDDAEEAEAAYAELVEYVRVSVQLVFEDLHDLRQSAGPVRH